MNYRLSYEAQPRNRPGHWSRVVVLAIATWGVTALFIDAGASLLSVEVRSRLPAVELQLACFWSPPVAGLIGIFGGIILLFRKTARDKFIGIVACLMSAASIVGFFLLLLSFVIRARGFK